MVENLRSRSGLTPTACVAAVRAAIVILAAKGEVRVKARVESSGGAPNETWVREALQWASQQGWMTKEEAAATEHRANQKITDMQEFVPTLLELGTGYEGATEGLKEAWTRVVTQDMTRQKITPRKRGDPGRWAVLEHKETFGKAAGHGRGMEPRANKTAGCALRPGNRRRQRQPEAAMCPAIAGGGGGADSAVATGGDGPR